MNMKNIKTKFILSVIVFMSVVGFSAPANAASSSLSVSPASLTKNAGSTFNVSVGLNAAGNKVCAVEGTLVFTNLSCQSISAAGDVMVQSAPTCSNPHFLIGIPNCGIADKNLLNVSVKALSAGTASVSGTGIDVVGEGVSVGSDLTAGSYTINAVTASTPQTTQTTPDQSTVTQPEQPQVEVQSEQPATTSDAIPMDSQAAAAGAASGNNNSLVWFIVAVIVIAIIFYGYKFYEKKKIQK
jgi:hypothetical protein